MKLKLLLGLIYILSLELKGQSETVISGSVTDTSGNPVPFSTIAIADYSRGTYCDINGHFILSVERLPVSIEITNIGYEKKKLLIEESTSMRISIILQEKKIMLDEIVITDAKVKPKIIGSPKKRKVGIYFSVENSFQQLGLMIRNKENQLYKNPIWLSLSVKINSWIVSGSKYGNKPNGKRQLRLRIYNIENNTDVGKDILHENIFLSPEKKGWYKVDLRGENLKLPKEGFVVAVEWLENQPIYEWKSKDYKQDIYGVGISGHRLSDEERQFYSTMRYRSISTGWQKPNHILEREQHIPCFQLEFIELE